MKKVSIIIPVYNTEKYVEKCMKSVLNQTYKNIEIIIVDDGSTDSSGQICDTFLSDDRVKVFHQIHKGTSCARNYGIEMAKGDFICFIDSDDYVEKDYIQILYDLITRYDTDIAVCGFDFVYNRRKSKDKGKKESDVLIFNNKQALEKMCDYNDCFMPICCNKIYKAKLFKDIRFPNGKKYEDLCLNIDVFSIVKKVAYKPIIKYHYFVDREDSSSKSTFSEREYDCIEFCEKLKIIMKDEYNSIIHGFYLANMIDICNKLIDINKIDKEFFVKIQKISRYKLLNLIVSNYMIQRKINVILFSINYRLYIMYYKLKRKLWKRKY